ncbi:MAG: hypothetical protein FWC89_06960, partial [Defluviitaleaceae bacterium]|nr:hypothetical protein [Defluviitaleaceae bacterium]
FNMVEDLDRERVEITNFTAVENARTNHAIQTRFISFLTIGALDAFVTTREGVEDVTAAGFTRPLTEVKQYLAEINPQLYATIEERLFVIEMESEVASEIESNDDSEYVQFIAVSLAGSPKLSLVGIDCENVYLCMIVNSERFYNIARALEVLLDGA